MGISPVISGLVKKHVELQTKLRDLEFEADNAEDEISHIAKTIKILDPDYPTEELRPKRRRFRRINSEVGNLKRFVGEYVASQCSEFTNKQVAEHLIAADKVRVRASDTAYLTLRIGIHLKQLSVLGMIQQVGRLKSKNAIRWKKVS